MVGLPPFDLQVCCNLLLSIERMFLEARTATCATEQNWELDGTTWQKFQCKTTRVPRTAARIKDVDVDFHNFQTSSVKKSVPSPQPQYPP